MKEKISKGLQNRMQDGVFRIIPSSREKETTNPNQTKPKLAD